MNPNPTRFGAADELPRTLPASQGVAWFFEGMRLYRKNPLLLSAAFGALFGVVMALGLVPFVGGAISELATPVLVAGFMAAYRALDNGDKLDMQPFFAGVRGPLVPLATLGAVQLLAMLLIGQIMFAMGFDPEAVVKIAQDARSTPADMQAVLSQSTPALMVGLALLAPLMLATAFAPALVLFGNARPATALGVSLKACLRNWAPLTLNGLVLGVLLLLSALVPLMLGLLFAMPVVLGSLYAAYQAMFAVWSEAGRP